MRRVDGAAASPGGGHADRPDTQKRDTGELYLVGRNRAETPVKSKMTARYASVSPCYEPTAE